MSGARTAIVFGGSGFLGHAVVQELARRDYFVRIPCRDARKGADLKLLGRTGQIEVFSSCLRTDAAVATAMAGSDSVVNLIGAFTEKKNASFQSLHIETAARIARIAKSGAVKRFLHVSAIGASADAPSRFARSKALGEQAVHAFFPAAVILRPSLMFGPRDLFLNRLVFAARFLPVLPLVGAKTRFQPVFVGDVARAIALALDAKGAQGKCFELGGPEVFSLETMAALVLAKMGRPRPVFPVPWRLAHWIARALELLPDPPLTRDRVLYLHSDGVAGSSCSGTFSDLGAGLTPWPHKSGQ